MDIYVVSLPEMHDRREAITRQLNTLYLEFKFWDAYKDQNGVRGLLLTMQDLLRYLVNTNEPVLILEDDALLLPEIDKLEDCIKQLPSNFDGLWLGCNLVERPNKLYSPNLINIKSAYTTHAVYYSPQGMKKLLIEIEHMLETSFTKPLDVLIVQTIQKEGNCYCTFPLMVSQAKGFSQIEQREVDYSIFIEKRFHNQTKHLL